MTERPVRRAVFTPLKSRLRAALVVRASCDVGWRLTAAPPGMMSAGTSVAKEDNNMDDLWLAHCRTHLPYMPRETRAELLNGVERELAHRELRAVSCRPTRTLTRRPQVRRPRARVRRTTRTQARAPDDPAPPHHPLAAARLVGERR